MRSIDQTVEQLYVSISFNEGEKPNFKLLKDRLCPNDLSMEATQ